jgi:hypothetical protein
MAKSLSFFEQLQAAKLRFLKTSEALFQAIYENPDWSSELSELQRQEYAQWLESREHSHG